MHTEEINYDGNLAIPLINSASRYLPEADVSTLRDAFEYSQQAHKGQFRKTGEPYVSTLLLYPAYLQNGILMRPR